MSKVEPPHYHDRTLDALAEIQHMMEEDLPKVPESVFVHYFLPVLTGEVLEGDEKATKVRLDYWINHATVRRAQNGNMTKPNPNLPVRVVSDTNANEILFTVPPIVPSFDDTTERSRVSIVKLIDVGMRKEEQHPNMGKLFVNTMLDDLFAASRAKHLSTTQKQWFAILARYNLTEKLLGVKATGEIATPDVNPISQAFSDEIDEL